MHLCAYVYECSLYAYLGKSDAKLFIVCVYVWCVCVSMYVSTCVCMHVCVCVYV